MNIKQELQRKHNLETAEKVAAYAMKSERQFASLVNILLHEEAQLQQHAAWAFGKAAEQKPEWLKPYQAKIVHSLKKFAHPAVKRNIYRSLQFQTLQPELEAAIFDQCLKDLENADNPVAIKVFAMSVAGKVALNHPGVAPELRLQIEHQFSRTSAGFRSRARKILVELKKMEPKI